MTSYCPCGSGSQYVNCCEPFITRSAYPPSAEALMRSRYSAFCKGQIDYLLITRHPLKRDLDSRQELQASIKASRWRSLNVIGSNENGSVGEVEFTAFYTSPNENPGQVHEKSSFVKENEQWYYVDGVHLPPLKQQRNDPCWCGSGKKLKKCCG